MHERRWYVGDVHGDPVEVQVGGYRYRVVSSAQPDEVRQLADVVDSKVRDLSPTGNAIDPQAILLAAISLAHEAETEREKRVTAEKRYKSQLAKMLDRIDNILEETQELPPPDPPADIIPHGNSPSA
jgi:cell division protein ZapA (FtsZ GTPase activity inhibitor)